MSKTLSKRLIILLALSFVLGVCCFFNRHLLTEPPFASNHAFDGPSGVFSGSSGRIYVVDTGNTSVLILDRDGQLERKIDASDKGFYYASLISEGSDGSIYVADTRYAMKGTILESESIFRYDRNGRNPQLLHTIDYSESDDPPMQYGRIKSLKEVGGKLVFAIESALGVQICAMDLDAGSIMSIEYDLGGAFISDIDVMPESMLPVFTTKLGDLYALNSTGGFDYYVSSEDGCAPWTIAVEDNFIYFTDLMRNELIRVDMETRAQTTVLWSEAALYTVSVMDGRIYSSDYMGFYLSSNEGEAYIDSVALANGSLRTLLWIALFIACIAALAAVVIILLPFLKRKKSQTFQRLAIAVIVSLCVSTLVTYIAIDQTVMQQGDSIMEQLGLFGDMLINTLDTQALDSISSISDYMSDDYISVRKPLDHLTQLTYDNNLYYYYGLCKTDGEMIYGIMDFEDTTPSWYPMYPLETEGYAEAFAGETISVSFELSSYGLWSFMLKPVFNQRGEIVAVLEIGANLDNLNAQRNVLVWQIILTVATFTIVLLILIIEALFLFEYFENRRTSIISVSGHFPVRTLVFFSFLADCMQDSFVSIYANQLYVPFAGIPQSVGAALPLSFQVLAAAIFALVGGWIIRAAGAKKTFFLGFLLQIAGFGLCAAIMNFEGLLVGKTFIGAGMGLIVVCANSVTAAEEDSEARANLFAAISAGMLAGVSAGVGIGSVILSLATFQIVYISGACILLIGLMIVFSCQEKILGLSEREKETTANVFQLLADKEVVAFLLFILTPFLVSISFKGYFFPIYAAENGMSEVDIGRIFLICGVVVIYAGPRLTELLIEKLGEKKTMIAASMLVSLATLIFVFSPTLPAAIAGIAILSISVSFGFAIQNTYYSSLSKVALYGESRSMGVYSLFDNIGQTIGPVMFGLAMMAGIRAGLLIIGAFVFILTCAFLAANSINNKKDKDSA